MKRKIISWVLALAMGFGLLSGARITVFAEDDVTTLSFSDGAIGETVSGSGYSISIDSDTSAPTLTITAAGIYKLTGSCDEGAVVVKKGLNDVVLILSDLTLSSSSTAPIVIGKATTAAIHLEGTNVLSDNEDPEDESDAFEGAAIKVKSAAEVTFCGDGDLTVNANAKNGIKGGSTASLIFNQSGTIRVSGSYSGYATTAGAYNNGIACDGSLVFNQGIFDIDAANDGIKSAPEATDESEGTEIDTDSAGMVTIHGGTFDISTDGDGIQADTALTVTNGSIGIQTMSGCGTDGTKYRTNGNTGSAYAFDPDTMSCKGLKASGDRAEEAGIEPAVTITGGDFVLNCADDAIHSDAFVTVTGGSFDISSGDDGMHADTTLELGTEDGTVARDPEVTVQCSYEGLEGGTVYIYQGRYFVNASDDGVNAAGGSDSSGSDTGGGFNPGGAHGPGGSAGQSTGSNDYNIYIHGGSLYVNCSGDGLDSNGGLYLTGGTQEIFSQSSGDNSAIDADGTISIDGAVVFTAGANPVMDPVNASWFGSSQKYKTLNTSLSSGRIVNATLSGTVLYSTKLPKAAGFFMYSAPSLSAVPSLAAASSLTACRSGSWGHSWDSGTVTAEASDTSEGLMTYTCTACGASETRTLPATVSVSACDHTAQVQEETSDEGYAITFKTNGHAGINIYYTQDYSSADETNVTSAVSRDAGTGEPDSSGSGQCNFTVVPDDGYELSGDPVISGNYKNLKGPSDTGMENTYRITKITGDLTVTVSTAASEEDVPVTGVTLDQDSLLLGGHDCAQLTAEVLPEDASNKTVSWQSSDTNVVTVDDTGLVTAVYRGKATVTVVTDDGQKTAECAVTVEFGDVMPGHVRYKVVSWGADNKIANGYKATNLFGVDDSCTRGQFVMLLWKLAGKPAPKSLTPAFQDVSTDNTFFRAVQWAYGEGITKGVTKTLFGVNQYCTRAQAMTFLWRYNGCPKSNSTYTFNDDPLPNATQQKAIMWGAKNGITGGTRNADGTKSFRPKDPCTRGHIMHFLYKMSLL